MSASEISPDGEWKLLLDDIPGKEAGDQIELQSLPLIVRYRKHANLFRTRIH
jgi:hypothetical protein